MFYSLSNILKSILYSFFMGAFLGTVYDFFRLVRVLSGESFSPAVRGLFPSRRVRSEGDASVPLLFVLDLLFSLFSAGAFALFLHHTARGVLRLYYLPAAALGFLLYKKTLGRAVIALFEGAVVGVGLAVAGVLRPVLGLVLRLWRNTGGRLFLKISSRIRSAAAEVREKNKKKTACEGNLCTAGRGRKYTKGRQP